jgi:hypothetical protein
MRKIVITIPPWAVPVMLGGVITGIAVPASFNLMLSIISFTLCFFALVQMLLARRMLKRARWDIHRLLRDIGNEEISDEDEDDNIRILHFPGKPDKTMTGAKYQRHEDSVSG